MFGYPPSDAGGGGSGGGPPENELELEKMWLQEARKDPDKFLFFYEKYLDHIYNYIYWKTLDHDLTKDLTGETFLRALAGLGKFQWQGHPFRIWLRTIAINVVRQHYRRMMKRRLLEEGELEAIPGPWSNPLADMILEERQRVLFLCVKKLDELNQKIFFLRFGDGLKLREIAAELGHPLGTIKARLHGIKKKISEMLAGSNPEEFRKE